MITIFLDIDGVFNSNKFYVERHKKGIKLKYCIENEIDDNVIFLLNQLIEKYEVQFVISSVYRIGNDFIELCDTLSKKGFKGKIVGRTPDFRSRANNKRGVEIEDYIIKNNIENYVIIDDDNDMLPKQFDRFVNVDGMFGLTSKDITKIENIISLTN